MLPVRVSPWQIAIVSISVIFGFEKKEFSEHPQAYEVTHRPRDNLIFEDQDKITGAAARRNVKL
jgi:hypothetical protein